MTKIKIVGYHEFDSKKGNRCRTVSVLMPMSGRGSNDIVEGEHAETYFLPDNLVGKIGKEDVGKTYNAYIAYYNGRSNLVDVIK